MGDGVNIAARIEGIADLGGIARRTHWTVPMSGDRLAAAVNWRMLARRAEEVEKASRNITSRSASESANSAR